MITLIKIMLSCMVLCILMVLYIQNKRVNKHNREIYNNLKKLDDADTNRL